MTRVLYTGMLLVALMGALAMTGVSCGASLDGPADAGGGNVVENSFPWTDADLTDADLTDADLPDGSIEDGGVNDGGR